MFPVEHLLNSYLLLQPPYFHLEILLGLLKGFSLAIITQIEGTGH
jgi:hypothetical protein